MLLGQVDGELVQDSPVAAAESSEQAAVTVHDDETERVVVPKQFVQCLSVELVVTQVQRSVDWFVRLEVDVDLLRFAVLCKTGTDRGSVIRLQPPNNSAATSATNQERWRHRGTRVACEMSEMFQNSLESGSMNTMRLPPSDQRRVYSLEMSLFAIELKSVCIIFLKQETFHGFSETQ